MTLTHRLPDGTLPPGEHHIAVLSELFTEFPATTTRRQALNAALDQFVEVVRRLALGTNIVIDGSYLTGKAEPQDVVLGLLSSGANETMTLQRLQLEGVNLTMLEVLVETTPPAFERWIAFFSTDRSGQARGVVLLTV
jgi:hypothetical protein